MPKHHEAFETLSPIDWDSVPADGIPEFLSETFTGAQTIIDSIPVPAPVKAAAANATRRPRSQTDPPAPSGSLINHSISARQSGASIQQAQDLMKEWKEVKINARDNPLSINVYKLAAKDGRGAWFARRSIHDGLTFDKWKLGLEREFLESMKVQTGPGAGSIRGIGADKRVEHHVADGIGKAEVYQLSAQFPGPTAPRDFVTLLMTGETPPQSEKKSGQRQLRSYIIVSKPVDHPECPPRQGIIRGQYESVEIIREVPTEKPPIRRSMSTVDVTSDDLHKRQAIAEDVGKDAVLRAAQKKMGHTEQRHRGVSVNSAPPTDSNGSQNGEQLPEEEDEVPTTIEWLMVTRSDPGGNVPRFMIERGTPGGIVSDAGKFLKWLTAKSAKDFPSEDDTTEVADPAKSSAVEAEDIKARSKSLAPAPTANLVPDERPHDGQSMTSQDSGYEYPSSNGLYGMISGAIGYASSAVAQRLPVVPFFGSAANSSDEALREVENEDSDSISDVSETSSVRSFASAVEGNGSEATPPPAANDAASSVSEESSLRTAGGLSSSANAHYDKDLKKIQEKRAKMHEKMARLQTRMTTRHADDSNKDAVAMAKLQEKHDKEVAKQEEKYRRELKRLEDKRESERRKAEERRRKQLEREDKASVKLELDRARSERDMALQQVELLKAQVGELQAQNTKLVAEMGRARGPVADVKGPRKDAMRRQDSVMSATSTRVATPT